MPKKVKFSEKPHLIFPLILKWKQPNRPEVERPERVGIYPQHIPQAKKGKE